MDVPERVIIPPSGSSAGPTSRMGRSAPQTIIGSNEGLASEMPVDRGATKPVIMAGFAIYVTALHYAVDPCLMPFFCTFEKTHIADISILPPAPGKYKFWIFLHIGILRRQFDPQFYHL